MPPSDTFPRHKKVLMTHLHKMAPRLAAAQSWSTAISVRPARLGAVPEGWLHEPVTANAGATTP